MTVSTPTTDAGRDSNNSNNSQAPTPADVLVAGYGPVGAVLAAMLGQRGLSTVVVEPMTEPFALPRAVGLDEETFRLLVRLPGLTGLLDQVHVTGRGQFLTADYRVLLDLGLGVGKLGMPVGAFFHQPSFEHDLRAGIATLPSVTVRLGRRVVGLRQDDDGVEVDLDDGSVTRARWVVGCDGASSQVRDLLGVDYVGSTFAQPWLVVDTATRSPLRDLPYFSFCLDPRRPSVNMPTPGGHRWEWMLLPGEDPAAMTEPDNLHALLREWADPDDVTVVRSAVYTFHARAAARWRVGRVLLAGDAAHSMPPFAGQGLAEGIRDAAGLAWRLAEVLNGHADQALLDDYERERRRTSRRPPPPRYASAGSCSPPTRGQRRWWARQCGSWAGLRFSAGHCATAPHGPALGSRTAPGAIERPPDRCSRTPGCERSPAASYDLTTS